MTFKVHIQNPKPKDMGLCGISLDQKGDALLLTPDGAEVVGNIARARVDWIHGHGIMISGMEANGFDQTGRPKYRYQEWFCAYVEAPPKQGLDKKQESVKSEKAGV